MKGLIGFVLCLFLANIAFGESPFPPYLENRFDALEFGSVKLHKAKYEFTSTQASGTEINLGKSLPARAIVIRSWLSIGDTAITSASNNEIAFGCGSASNNLRAATDFTDNAAHGVIDGAVTGASSTFVSIGSSACDLKLYVGPSGFGPGVNAGSGITAGKITLFVQYVLGDFATE